MISYITYLLYNNYPARPARAATQWDYIAIYAPRIACATQPRNERTRSEPRVEIVKEVKRLRRETLESVSSCTRFSGILKISNFGFNRSSSKLVGMFFGIVPMFVLKDFVQDCFVAQICAKMCVRAVIRAYLRDEAIRNKILGYEHWNYPKEHAYQF